MSAIEDIITTVEALLGKLGEASTSAAAAVSEAGDGLTAAEAVGIDSSVEVMSALKEQLEAITAQLAGVTESVEETKQAAEAIAAGT